MTEADYIAQRIAEIRRQHEAELKPFIDRLVWLRSLELSRLELMAEKLQALATPAADLSREERVALLTAAGVREGDLSGIADRPGGGYVVAVRRGKRETDRQAPV